MIHRVVQTSESPCPHFVKTTELSDGTRLYWALWAQPADLVVEQKLEQRVG